MGLPAVFMLSMRPSLVVRSTGLLVQALEHHGGEVTLSIALPEDS